ncbi:hypothetical protein DENSPDRAFT_141575 [Dentipellis sp. KUC8613]|nr:hypothetical protein DENSPDRAFT_141575 [Dentipellis sp. KUC8613]
MLSRRLQFEFKSEFADTILTRIARCPCRGPARTEWPAGNNVDLHGQLPGCMRVQQSNATQRHDIRAFVDQGPSPQAGRSRGFSAMARRCNSNICPAVLIHSLSCRGDLHPRCPTMAVECTDHHMSSGTYSENVLQSISIQNAYSLPRSKRTIYIHPTPAPTIPLLTAYSRVYETKMVYIRPSPMVGYICQHRYHDCPRVHIYAANNRHHQACAQVP